MIALDTNVLVRVLVDDESEPWQIQAARNLLKQHRAAWISKIVLVETVWVLESAFAFGKPEVLKALAALLRRPGITFEDPDTVKEAVNLYTDSSADFADCLILATATSRLRVLYTFDRKLGRLHGAHRLEKISS